MGETMQMNIIGSVNGVAKYEEIVDLPAGMPAEEIRVRVAAAHARISQRFIADHPLDLTDPNALASFPELTFQWSKP